MALLTPPEKTSTLLANTQESQSRHKRDPAPGSPHYTVKPASSLVLESLAYTPVRKETSDFYPSSNLTYFVIVAQIYQFQRDFSLPGQEAMVDFMVTGICVREQTMGLEPGL